MPYINGQYVVTPQASVIVNDNALTAPAVAPGLGLLLIGPATDGEPQTPIVLSSPGQAVQALKGGDLLQGALLAFSPGAGLQGPGSVTVIRPEAATQATSAVKDAAGTATEISLTTTSYGTLANDAKWMVQAGTTSGYNVTLATDFVGPGGQTYPPASQANVGLQAASLYYTGTGTSPTYTVTDTEFTVAAVTSDTGGTITFTSTMTIAQLAAQVSQFTGWVMTATDPNPNDLVAPGSTAIPALLDNVSAATVGTTQATATAITANVAAVVNWINGTGAYFTAARAAGATALATSSTWTYATGGTTPAATTSNWTDAYTVAQSIVGISIVVPVAGGPATPTSTPPYQWSDNDAHCSYMASIGQPRRGYVGDLLGMSLADETTYASGLNSNRTSLVWPGSKGSDYNGNATTFAPYLVACQVAGARAGLPLTGKLTQTAIGSGGLEVALTPAQVAQANAGGIACLAQASNGTIVVSWDRTTWLQSGAYDKVENLTGVAIDAVTVDLNQTLQLFVGKPITARTLGHAQTAIYGRLVYWKRQGVIVATPKPSDVSLSASGNQITGSASAAFEVPANYIALTLYARAYSGAA